MRFMGFVKTAEGQGDPPQALMEAMGQYIEKSFKSGVLIDTGGLAGSADAIHVRLSQGKVAVVDGPFSESKEWIGGYAILECPSQAEAEAVAKEFMGLHVANWPGWEGECEVRRIYGPND